MLAPFGVSCTVPVTVAEAGNSPIRANDVTDFPLPEAPMSAHVSPGSMLNETASTATNGFSPLKVTCRLLTCIAGCDIEWLGNFVGQK